MKLLIYSLFFSLASFNALAQSKLMPQDSFASEDFMKLSAQDQREFVRELRNIMSDLDAKSDFLALEIASPARNIAASDEECPIDKSYNYTTGAPLSAARTAYSKFRSIDQSKSRSSMTACDFVDAKRALTILAGIAKERPQDRAEAKKIFNELSSELNSKSVPAYVQRFLNGQEAAFNRVANGLNPRAYNRDGTPAGGQDSSDEVRAVSAKVRTSEKATTQTSSRRKTADSGSGSGSSTLKTSSTYTASIRNGGSSRTKTARAQSAASTETSTADSGSSKAAAKDTVRATVKDSVKAKSSPPPAPAVKEKNSAKDNFEFSSCLYSGFVINSTVCKPPREIPANFTLMDNIDKMKFTCAASNEAICNPLLFGYEGDCSVDLKSAQINIDVRACLAKSKPVCVVPSVDATKNCTEKTKSDKYLDRAVAVIKAKPAMLDQYLKDFSTLCDPTKTEKNKLIYKNADGSDRSNAAGIKKDIEDTCKVAQPRVELLKSRAKAAVTATKPVAKPDIKAEK